MKEFTDLDKIIHSFPRLNIIQRILLNGPISFSDLRKKTELTSGNLHTHCTVLEKAGYIEKMKMLEKNGLITQFSVSDIGKKAYLDYLTTMKEYINMQIFKYEDPINRTSLPPSMLIEMHDPEGNSFSLASFD